MARFNKAKKNLVLTKNYEGETAVKLNDALKLYQLACVAFIEDQFYRSRSELENEIRELVKNNDSEYIAKLAVYSRREMNLRSFPLYLLNTAINLGKHKGYEKLYRKAIYEVVQRADEIAEFLATYKYINGKLKPIANIIKKGLREAFHKFDEYQFAKYKGNTREIKLVDAINLLHPKPKTEEENELFRKIVKNELETPFTWEVELTRRTTDEERLEFWKEIIDTRRLGYMAAIRNMRNILKVADNELVEMYIDYIQDERLIKKSRMFPFRIYTAYKIFKTMKRNEIVDMYKEKLINAFKNIIEIMFKDYIEDNDFWKKDEKVLIASDMSGSMDSNLSNHSIMTYKDVAVFYGAIFKKFLDGRFFVFATELEEVDMWINDLFKLIEKVESINIGFSTNGYLIFEKLLEDEVYDVDKIVVFSDYQWWSDDNITMSTIESYLKKNKKVKLYFVDLAGYGQMPIKLVKDRIMSISGFSEKMFDAVNQIEKGASVVEIINNYVI